jgi:hypothetical protein
MEWEYNNNRINKHNKITEKYQQWIGLNGTDL